MAMLIADCPRCGVKQMTFQLLTAHNISTTSHSSPLYSVEAFCVCGASNCGKATIFILGTNEYHENLAVKLCKYTKSAVNGIARIVNYVNIKDTAKEQPPEHVPEEIADVFREGATCLAVECFNAAGTMFRLCVDLTTKPMLPEEDVNGLNKHIRRSLGERLKWLFANGELHESLKELSTCIKEDGNDGAHEGTLTKEEAEDLLDFTVILLERIYTEPINVELANERRIKRRNSK